MRLSFKPAQLSWKIYQTKKNPPTIFWQEGFRFVELLGLLTRIYHGLLYWGHPIWYGGKWIILFHNPDSTMKIKNPLTRRGSREERMRKDVLYILTVKLAGIAIPYL